MTRDLTLSQALLPQTSLARHALLALGGSAVIAMAAQVSLQIGPVPLTLQTLAVLAVGMAFGSRLALATLLLYVAEGAMGLPVFSGGKAGIATLMGPSGGYIFGFVMAATMVGWLAERGWDRSVVMTALAMALGNVVLYVPGLIQLQLVTGAEWAQVWAWGAGPFLLGDAIKLAIAALAMPGAWSLMAMLKR